MKIPIVFSTDHNYVMQTGVAILSLLKSAIESTYEIYVLINSNVNEEDKRLLKRQVSLFSDHSIKFIEIGEAFKDSFEIRGISNAAYYRLLIPWFLPNYEKVIYSDVDVIFKIDLGSIYKEDISKYLVAAVPAVGPYIYKKFANYILKKNLNPEEYYNSGFLIINCKKQRNKNLRDTYIEEAKKEYIYQDQDIINIVCKNEIKSISTKYCITPYFYKLVKTNDKLLHQKYGMPSSISKYLKGEDCILHYAGPKPWNTFTHGWVDWMMTYRESIFYDENKELEIADNILYPRSWKKIASMIKHNLRYL